MAKKELVQNVLIESEEIVARIKSMADEIAADFKEQTAGENEPELVLLCVLDSAKVFVKKLATELEDRGVKVKIRNVRIKSYDGMEKTDRHIINFKFHTEELSGKIVLVVEDMIDTGGTLEALMLALKQFKTRSVDIAILLEKIKKRDIYLSAKYVGFLIFDLWVHGFGIDTYDDYRKLEKLMYVMLRDNDKVLAEFWRLFILNSEDKAFIESVRSLMIMLSRYNEKENEKYKYKDNSKGLPNSHRKLPGSEVNIPGQRRDKSEARRGNRGYKQLLPHGELKRPQGRS